MSLYNEIKENLDGVWFDVCKTIYQNKIVGHPQWSQMGLEEFMELCERLAKSNGPGFTEYLVQLAGQYKKGIL